MSAISVTEVTKKFGDTSALSNLSLSVEPGEFVVLLGPSGSGKSTALRLVAGLETPTSGTIELFGQTVADATTSLPPNHRDIGFVFQSYALWPHLNVFRNVEYPLRARRPELSKAERATLVEEALELVSLGHLAKRRPNQLSGGEQQRVALARALVSRPKLLLFDEPLSNLDAKLRVKLRAQIHELHQELGFTALYVTHDQAEAFALGDLVVVFDHGRVLQKGAATDIFHRPENPFVADFVGFDNIHPVTRLVNGKVGPATVITQAATFFSAPGAAAAMPATDAVSVALRAEDVVAYPDPRADAVEAHIRGIEYRGSGYYASLDIAGEQWFGHLPFSEWGDDIDAALKARDRRVHVVINGSHSVLLPAADATGSI